MINVHIPSAVGSNRAEPTIWRPGSRAFWALLVLEGLLILAGALVVLANLPPATPLRHDDQVWQVRDFVLAGEGASDPILEVAPGVMQRSSSVRGLSLGGQTYYYYFEGQPSFDPLSRGAVRPEQIELLLRDDGGEHTLVIYRVLNA